MVFCIYERVANLYFFIIILAHLGPLIVSHDTANGTPEPGVR